ncbi:MAG: hypothetical protein AAGA80_15925, partial [Cyanobacteria bacterium P01_F01_bin.143]
MSVDDFQKKIQVEKIAFIIAPAHWSQVKELGNLSRGKKNHVKPRILCLEQVAEIEEHKIGIGLQNGFDAEVARIG